MIKKPNSSCIKQPLYLGSSETTREASFFDFCDYQTYGKPDHIKFQQHQNYYDFLIWFIGFSEGDGCFFFTEKSLFFMINQKNPKVLYKIRKQLGFGIVRKYVQNKKQYYRLDISTKKNVLRLIYLFNGNLILDKVYKKFKSWVGKANQLRQLNIKIKSKKPEINLKNSWLSGFIEADGGFYARIRKRPKMAVKYQLNMKFYMTQKGELCTLKQIIDLLKAKVNIFEFCQNSILYNRIEICSLLSHTILLDYLERYLFI